ARYKKTLESSNTFFIMSITTSTINVRGNLSASDDIPYTKYFELCSYENWSLHHYVSVMIDNYKFVRKDTAHHKGKLIFGIIRFDGAYSQVLVPIGHELVGAMQVLKWM
ncbi:9563_t:CDS:2, partial [Funneliformis geosporum]